MNLLARTGVLRRTRQTNSTKKTSPQEPAAGARIAREARSGHHALPGSSDRRAAGHRAGVLFVLQCELRDGRIHSAVALDELHDLHRSRIDEDVLGKSI